MVCFRPIDEFGNVIGEQRKLDGLRIDRVDRLQRQARANRYLDALGGDKVRDARRSLIAFAAEDEVVPVNATAFTYGYARCALLSGGSRDRTQRLQG